MKKLVMAMTLAAGLTTSWAQNGDLYKRYTTVSNNYHFNVPVDYIVEGTTRAVGLVQMDSAGPTVKSVTGMIKVDLNAGTGITGRVYASPRATYLASRVLAIGGNYYQLGNYYNSIGTSTTLSKINGTTGAVMFSEYIAGSRCSFRNFTNADMVYDGSAYIYVLGSLQPAVGPPQSWVAKFDLSGVMQWEKALVNEQYGSVPNNIYYYNDTCIYIGGTVDLASFQTTGLIVRIDNNGVIKKAKTISYFTFPNSTSLRMHVTNIKRNGNYLYVIGQPYQSHDEVGALMIVKLDVDMNLVAYHVFNSTISGFTFDPEFYFATNAGTTKLLVPGNTNYLDNHTYNGYVNAFFDLNTNFLNANNLGLTTSQYGFQLSYPAGSGHIFSIGQDGSSTSNTDMYYIKGAPGNDHTSCDSSYTFQTEQDSLYLALYPLADSTMSNTTCSFSLTVFTPTFTPNSICYYCAACQRKAQPEKSNGTAEGSVNIYPNPSNGHITVSFSFEEARNLDIKVLSTLGETVYKTSQSAVERNTFEYDLSFLPKGAYIVHIVDDTGTKTTRKIMIE